MLETRMHERCATCAFRPGTDAANSEWTQLKAKLCILSGDTFICHAADREAWCAGVMDAIERRIRSGEMQATPQWKQKIYLNLLDVIEKAEDRIKAGLPPLTEAESMELVRRAAVAGIDAAARQAS